MIIYWDQKIKLIGIIEIKALMVNTYFLVMIKVITNNLNQFIK